MGRVVDRGVLRRIILRDLDCRRRVGRVFRFVGNPLERGSVGRCTDSNV